MLGSSLGMHGGPWSQAVPLYFLFVLMYCLSLGASSGLMQDSCQLTKGDWCEKFLNRPKLAYGPAPRGDLNCPNQCNTVGSCNHDLGVCLCPAGWTGDGCETIQKRPCTHRYRRLTDPPNVPMSHIDPISKEDLEWQQRGSTYSRCAGVCDDDFATCYCGLNSTYRRIPAPPGSPPGTPPLQAGRLLSPFSKPAMDEFSNKLHWRRNEVPFKALYGPNGWCNSNTPIYRSQCTIDGLSGTLCDWYSAAFCPNQCTGHGECQRGFCKCHEGWYGQDCARKRASSPVLPSESFDNMPAWLKDVVEIPPASADTPAASTQRKRPFIYVYDLPSMYNSRMLQYSNSGSMCSWRDFGMQNQSNFKIKWGYMIETALHEMMLTSSHRTFDPQEADFYYVPAYTACLIHPVIGFADFPWFQAPGKWRGAPDNRVMHATGMLEEVREWIQKTHPWWDRRQGSDHIWLAVHDEGACYFPTSVYKTSIVFTHWGRLDVNHTSNTAYRPDNYSKSVTWPSLQDKDWQLSIKGHPCFDPKKDLVIPGFKPPSHFLSSPLLGVPPFKHDILMFFRGDCGHKRLRHYSRGIRQKVYNLSREHDWQYKYNIIIGTRKEVDGDYSEFLAKSKFCLAAPGDGYAMRVEDAILHGCVPVIIMDNVQAVFESVLDFDQFSIRLKENEIDQLPAILKAVSDERLLELQTNLAKIWTRFVYMGNKIYRTHVQELLQFQNTSLQSISTSMLKDHPYRAKQTWLTDGAQDAFSTIMAWLYNKIKQ